MRYSRLLGCEMTHIQICFDSSPVSFFYWSRSFLRVKTIRRHYLSFSTDPGHLSFVVLDTSYPWTWKRQRDKCPTPTPRLCRPLESKITTETFLRGPSADGSGSWSRVSVTSPTSTVPLGITIHPCSLSPRE